MHKLYGVDGQMWMNEAIPLSIIITEEYQIVCKKKVNRLEEITIPSNGIHNSSNRLMQRTMGDNNRWRCIWLISLEYSLTRLLDQTLHFFTSTFLFLLFFIHLSALHHCMLLYFANLLFLFVFASWSTQIRWNFGRGQFDLSIRERDENHNDESQTVQTIKLIQIIESACINSN